MDDEQPSIELLESTHTFPGTYRIKVIGAAEEDFAARVIAAVRSELAAPSELDSSVRETPGGRHVAVTLDLPARSAEHVLVIYARIRETAGLMFLF